MFNSLRQFGRSLIHRTPLSKFFKSANMEVDAEDLLYYSHQKLTYLIHKKGIEHQDEAFLEYLKSLKFKSVQDFKENLEWFNVSEPLSLTNHLKGKIVLLDFFTYCCINCMHILPELKELENEFSIEDGLVVIGVHSAKFANEKISSNILAAVQRYNITHPVVNDSEAIMWKNCDIHCWPTLLMLGPNGNPIVMLMGEGHKEDLRLYVKKAIEFYGEKNEISHHKLPIKSAYHFLPTLKGPLLFPGKITFFHDEKHDADILAISDTSNNRILVINSDGTLLEQVGGSQAGFKDGNLLEALFSAPQGLAFQNKDILYVADTENHAIRKIDLCNKIVETVAGNGKQGIDRRGGKKGKHQDISSPWDVCVYVTSDLDNNAQPQPENVVPKYVLIIAMAGTHQIWALFLDDVVWWKNVRYTSGTCICIAGSGREENRNNQYPQNAAFAQPSGVALCNKKKEVYIADSESSSIRRLSLLDGKVTAVVGGERNPNNLFAFGDKDGKQYDAKLQHVLGVATSPDETTLYVADTYNHKIKAVNTVENTVITLCGSKQVETDNDILVFNEPGGLCASVDGTKLFVADTNNHLLKVIGLESNTSVQYVIKLDLKLDNKEFEPKWDKSTLETIANKSAIVSTNGGKFIMNIDFEFVNGFGLTVDAPQKWNVDLPSASWSCVPNSGTNIRETNVVISVPPGNEQQNLDFDFIFHLITCTADTCLPKNFIIKQPITFTNDGPTELNGIVKVVMEPSKIILQ